MTYLDERIEFRVDLRSNNTLPVEGVYRYAIYEKTDWIEPGSSTLIFTGTFYYDSSDRYYTFDITDIVRSRKESVDKKYFFSINNYTGVSLKLMKRYKVIAYVNSSEFTNSWKNVAMIYRYPNVKKGLTDGDVVFDNIIGKYDKALALIQGYKDETQIPLISHYPLKFTNKIKFCQSFINSDDVLEFQLYLANSQFNDYYSLSVAQEGNTTGVFIPLTMIVDWQYYEQELDRDVNVFKMIGNDFYTQIAVFDYCYKRYYLLWQDRYGGYQCQAFNDSLTFSETFDVTETQNYKNERKKSSIQIQPKWKLNSGWIKEEVFPCYESIYVSPILILYDAYEDVSYEVMVNSNYTEKTFKNEKKMLNISLDLEAVSKQNIIY